MDTITIYMSTYNGEQYLEEQINSILNQKEVLVNLVIRDDGSNDNTRKVLERIEKYHNVSVIYGDNLGYANSFLMLLLYEAESDYYGFADQDDYWKPDKLISAIAKLKASTSSYSVYASTLDVVNSKLEPLTKKKYDGMICTLGSILSRNRLAGCTMVFKRELKNRIYSIVDITIKENQYGFGHDGWILLYSLLYGGEIIIDENSYIKYRRHLGSVTNIRKSFYKRFNNELIMFINKQDRRFKIAKFLLKQSNEFLAVDAINTLVDIVKYRSSFFVRCKLFFGHEINTGIFVVDIKNKVAVLLNRY